VLGLCGLRGCLRAGLAQAGGLESGRGLGIGFRYFIKGFKQMNSNLNLNSSKQKKCTSMNATINSYMSLTLF
jgi:hypothetical protein